MELLISLITNNEVKASSIAELTQNKYFKRKWSSIYRALGSYYGGRKEKDKSKLRDLERKKIFDYLIQKQVTTKEKVVILIDTTCKSKKHSAKAADRTYIKPCNTKTSEPGYEYSVVCAASEPKWVPPILIDRVKSTDNRYCKGVEQILQVRKQTSKEIVVIGDSGYSANSFVAPLYENNITTITRQRANRAIYEAFDGAQKTKGRHKIYGDKISYNNIAHEEIIINHNEKIKIVEYKNALVKGNKNYKMSDKKSNFIKVEVFGKDGNKKYKRDLVLCVSGKNKDKISAKQAYLYYKQRFDIEHFFKFGKTKLLMNKFQTNDPDRDEDFMMFISLAYNILYHAKNEIQNLKLTPWARPWDKKQTDIQNLSPAQVYRSITQIIPDNIVNSVKTRGIPTEKNIRKSYTIKPKTPVIRKQIVQEKIEITIKSTFGNQTKYTKTSINKNSLPPDDFKDKISNKISAAIADFA